MTTASAPLRPATVPFPSPSIDASFRPARALLGWMEPEHAHQALAVGHDGGVTDAVIARAAEARRATSTRVYEAPASTSIEPSITGVGDYLERFRPTVQSDLDAGWRFATVDLEQLIALQPITFTDHYAEQTYDIDNGDLRQVARITLPVPDDRPPLVQADPNGHLWIVSSNNPHLQVVEALQDTDTGAFGFRLGRPTSVLKVAMVDGRAICLDGHHRVYQLLRRHISRAPAIFRRFASLADVPQLPTGLLAEKTVLSDTPPRIIDLLDDAVSAPVLAPATRKYLLIEAREMVLPV